MSATFMMKPTVAKTMQVNRSSFAGGDLSAAFNNLSVSRSSPETCRPRVVTVESKRVCSVTGKKRNNAMAVSFSHRRTHKVQEVNLITKKVYWEREKRMVKIKMAASTLRTIQRNGLEATCKKHGFDLYKAPYTDVSENRRNWLAENKGVMPKKKGYTRGQFDSSHAEWKAFKAERREAKKAYDERKARDKANVEAYNEMMRAQGKCPSEPQVV